MGGDKQKWFSVFGDGAQWIQATINSILGLAFGVAIALFVFKIITLGIKAHHSESDEEKAIIRKTLIKNGAILIVLFAVVGIVFTVVNVIPAPSSQEVGKKYFDKLDGGTGDASKYFNLGMTIAIAIAIISAIISIIIASHKYLSTNDDEQKVKIRKHIVNVLGWLSLAVLALFITQVVLNVIPAPQEM